MKSTKLQALSLRAKFQGQFVQVVVMNNDTGEIQIEEFPILIGDSIILGAYRSKHARSRKVISEKESTSNDSEEDN